MFFTSDHISGQCGEQEIHGRPFALSTGAQGKGEQQYETWCPCTAWGKGEQS